ncbi:WXG100 family type VII secretion target [Aquipuribacter nitratireducens]|uniref:ESAT-6-like protein n=1 Tax=Aquipuribacter nitratireducens TaxID=650104 RepID=A0ABW0GNC7_9MICO
MTRFEVDSAQVEAASARVQVASEQVGAEVDAMMRHLEDLQGTWRGQAATGFAALVEQWRATQLQVRESLDGIQVALAHAGRQYAETEAAAARMFAG